MITVKKAEVTMRTPLEDGTFDIVMTVTTTDDVVRDYPLNVDAEFDIGRKMACRMSEATQEANMTAPVQSWDVVWSY
jgi:hypothetical protein